MYSPPCSNKFSFVKVNQSQFLLIVTRKLQNTFLHIKYRNIVISQGLNKQDVILGLLTTYFPTGPHIKGIIQDFLNIELDFPIVKMTLETNSITKVIYLRAGGIKDHLTLDSHRYVHKTSREMPSISFSSIFRFLYRRTRTHVPVLYSNTGLSNQPWMNFPKYLFSTFT